MKGQEGREISIYTVFMKVEYGNQYCTAVAACAGLTAVEQHLLL